MSIASELTNLRTNLSNAYDAISNKGGTLPTDKNTANLAMAINSILGGGIDITSVLPGCEKAETGSFIGDGQMNHTVSHSLGVPPCFAMVWCETYATESTHTQGADMQSNVFIIKYQDPRLSISNGTVTSGEGITFSFSLARGDYNAALFANTSGFMTSLSGAPIYLAGDGIYGQTQRSSPYHSTSSSIILRGTQAFRLNDTFKYLLMSPEA